MIGWLLVIATWSTSSLQAQDLVGRHMPPYPDGLARIHDRCLSDSGEPARACDYAVTVLGVPAVAGAAPVPRFVVASRRGGASGASPRGIVDALPYPASGPRQYFQSGSCRLDGIEDDRVIALVHHTDPAQARITEIAWAARLDLADARFTLLEAARVDCANEAHGL